MRWSGVIAIIIATVSSGTDSFTMPCGKSLPTWAYNNGECDKKAVQYSQNKASSQLLGGQTSLNYDLKKNNGIETVSMGAQYTNDLFLAKFQGAFIKGKNENIPPVGKTNLLMQYRKKLWDSLSLSASENIYFPLKMSNEQTDPMKYTSLLKALYPVSNVYNVFAEGSYSLLDTPASETSMYRNPYSYTTGITYAEDPDMAINASYMLVQEADPALKSNQKIKIAHKHKINKKIKTSFSVIKSLESVQQDKALFDVNYAF